MLKSVVGLLLSGLVTVAAAADAGLAEGQKLHAQNCQRCHDGMFNDKRGEQLYSADFRKIKTSTALRQRIESCAVQVNAGWFDEEIDQVHKYLNQKYYRFK